MEKNMELNKIKQDSLWRSPEGVKILMYSRAHCPMTRCLIEPGSILDTKDMAPNQTGKVPRVWSPVSVGRQTI